LEGGGRTAFMVFSLVPLVRAAYLVRAPLTRRSATEALAWWAAYNSRERIKLSYEEGNPARLVVDEPTPHDVTVATIKAFPFPLSNREFVARLVAVNDDSGLLLATESVGDIVDYGMYVRTVRGFTRALTRFTPLSPDMCKVTHYQYADVVGYIPTRVVNLMLVVTIKAVDDLRKEFEKDDEVDKIARDKIANVMRKEPQCYSSEEEEVRKKSEPTVCLCMAPNTPLHLATLARRQQARGAQMGGLSTP